MLSRLIADIASRLFRSKNHGRNTSAMALAMPAADTAVPPPASSISAEEFHRQGLALAETGNPAAAAEIYRASITAWPENPALRVNASNIFKTLGRIDEAREHLERAIQLGPGIAGAWYNLGVLLHETWWLLEALNAFHRAYELEKLNGPTHLCRAIVMSIGLAFQQSGQWKKSRDFLDGIGEIFPSFASECERIALFTWVEDNTASPEKRMLAHVRWAQKHADPQLPKNPDHRNTRDSERPLKVGYVSGDFRAHAVSIFFEPLLRHHDPQSFRVTCYDNTQKTDAITAVLKGIAPQWREISNDSDEQLARQIREDGIDILVDLSGHTARNRLGAFALKPAPIQITWLGSRLATGMVAMDYRLSDNHVDPPGESDHWHRERLLRLHGSQWCYGEPHSSPDVSPLPMFTNGFVTFGSFNLVDKLNDEVLSAWAEILRGLPGSRLVMVGIPFGQFRDRLLDKLHALGIDASRIELHGYLKRELFQAMHRTVDIALDSFPYNGGTTTCESLWMGVPVLAIAGDSTSGRTAISLLSAALLTDWLIPDRAAYVRTALERAGDPEALSQRRMHMRRHLRASPLMDGAAFAKDFEAALRSAWRDWCANGPANP